MTDPLASLPLSIRQEVQQIQAELLMAKHFLHQAGTDPEAWIDGCLKRLADLLAGVVPPREAPDKGE